MVADTINKGKGHFVASDESRMFSTHFTDDKPAEKHTQPNAITDYPGKQAVSFSFF